MIKLTDCLPDFLPATAARVRIQSSFDAYGKYSIALFWIQTDGDGCPCAVISKVDGAMTVSALSDGIDVGELTEFIRMIGAGSVMSDFPLPLENEQQLCQLVRHINAHPVLPCNADLRSAYKIESECFDMPPFDVWYADMSHRVRHNCATAAVNEYSAAIAFTCKGGALIIGVCTLPQYRKRGNGKAIIGSIMSTISDIDTFVITDNEYNSTFYVNNGFKRAGIIYSYEFTGA